ncbi:MAG: hypothetical protein ACHBN1_25450 [Heteroscytonema crispum UTEX LB 1556]
MTEFVFPLTGVEKARLRAGLEAAFTIPIIDDVEDFVWEALFHYVKNIPLPDPITQGRTKQLFDAVASDGRGWSLKTLVSRNFTVGSSFEFVIQRANIFQKAAQLGFPEGLNSSSDIANLGAALIRHWNEKHQRDCIAQNVTDPPIVILLKNRLRKRLAYVEFAYPILQEADYRWRWSREGGFGLQGWKDEQVHLKWYPSGTQLFQVFQMPENAYYFELEWQKATLSNFVENVIRTLAE